MNLLITKKIITTEIDDSKLKRGKAGTIYQISLVSENEITERKLKKTTFNNTVKFLKKPVNKAKGNEKAANTKSILPNL